ncbi:amidohydrolase family protein [Sphingomonas sp. PAMC 26621]|uniref:amidohydrolase family protein n=1 Tax=Sphingomonas sp. PAMC 26621 TaxID=1112213 RepID=UPI001EE63F06|nr:amidohydrolase family protein [Sphingomonas sp. PAMC 26621]
MNIRRSLPASGHLSRPAVSRLKRCAIGMAIRAAAVLAGAGAASAQVLFQSPPIPGAPAMADEVREFVSFDASHGTLRLIHIRVIDGTGAPPLEDRTVTIKNGRIAEIAPSSASAPADGIQTLDMTGRTLLPGLVGMHDHLFYVARPGADFEHAQRIPLLLPQMTYTSPRLYLAGGVTTIRTTGSMEPYADLNLKQAIESNQLPGPHMDVTGPYLQGAGNIFLQMHTLLGPEDARDTVNYWAGQGVTSFKAYQNITRAELKAAIDAAHRHGLKITGHLCSITYPEAAELGIDNIEHGFSDNTQLDPDKKADLCSDSQGSATETAMDPDGPEAKALYALLIARHVAITSTLPVVDVEETGVPPLRQAELDLLTPQAREAYLDARNAQSTANTARKARRYASLKRLEAFERNFALAGGTLMAGCDPTGDGHIIPGFADQREIELLVDAGFSPLEAIRIGTLNGATYLGQAREIGSVTVGKRADLMIVQGDPSQRIRDIENVQLVFRDGIGFDPARLLRSVKGLYGLY